MEIAAAKFKATCLQLMDRVATTGETIVITKHGRPIAQLVAAAPEKKKRTGYGSGKGTFTVTDPNDDLFSTGEKWDADPSTW